MNGGRCCRSYAPEGNSRWHTACTAMCQRRPCLTVLFGWRADSSDGRPGDALGTPEKEFVRAQSGPPGFHIPHPNLPLEEAIMCDRIGCMHFPKLSEMDFSGPPA